MSEAAGTCIHCGCTRENPCVFGRDLIGRNITCTLLHTAKSNHGRAVCSNRACHEAEVEYLFAQIEERQQKAESALCP